MNFRRKFLPVTLAVLLGVGAVGIANAATPFDRVMDTPQQIEHQNRSSMAPVKQNVTANVTKAVPAVTVSTTKIKNEEIDKTESQTTAHNMTQTNTQNFRHDSNMQNHDQMQGHGQMQNHDYDQDHTGWHTSGHDGHEHSGSRMMHDWQIK